MEEGKENFVTKLCAKCNQTKPTSEFTIDNSRFDGLCRTCKDCEREGRQRRYNEKKEKREKIKQELLMKEIRRVQKLEKQNGVTADPPVDVRDARDEYLRGYQEGFESGYAKGVTYASNLRLTGSMV